MADTCVDAVRSGNFRKREEDLYSHPLLQLNKEALQVISDVETARSHYGSLDANRVSLPPEVARRVAAFAQPSLGHSGEVNKDLMEVENEDSAEAEEVLSQLQAAEEAPLVDFPNLLMEAIDAGLKFEQRMIAQLKGHEKTVDGYLENINELLNLNAKLAALPDKKEQATPQEIKEIFERLEAKGIHFGNVDKLSKERRLELKSLINSQIDQHRTRIQTTFTKMQTTIQNMSSVIDTLKRILQDMNRLSGTLTRNQRAGA